MSIYSVASEGTIYVSRLSPIEGEIDKLLNKIRNLEGRLERVLEEKPDKPKEDSALIGKKSILGDLMDLNSKLEDILNRLQI